MAAKDQDMPATYSNLYRFERLFVGETWKCIIECIWNRSLTNYHICYSNNISKAKYIIYFNQCCVHYLCSWIYLNFQHTGNFIIFLGIQNLCITFAQALANLIQTETLKSHWETQSCCGIFSTASLFAGLGTSLRWISPSVSNCLKCHSMANSPSSRLSFHCKILYHIYRVYFSMGDGEKSPRIKKREDGGCQSENIKGLDANNWVQNTTFINNLDGGSCP